MPTFSNSPIPREDTVPTSAAVPPETADEVKTTANETSAEEAPAAEAPAEVSAAADEIESTAKEAPAEGTPAEEAPKPPRSRPAFRPTPDDGVVIRNFGKAPPTAVDKLNADFGFSMSQHSFTRLQDLFRNILKRDPTAGELRLLDALDREGRGEPDRAAVGELYTDSPAIAETWADMMQKHSELYAAEGQRRTDNRPAPPCTFEEALTLVGRYLHRTGRTLPASDRLPFGGKNSDGRTAVLVAPWQEADALAEGYAPVARVEMEGVVRSVWMRKGPALVETPEKTGDFLVLLPAAAPETVEALLRQERSKSRPSVGGAAAISRRSVLSAILSLCDGAEIFADRLPKAGETASHGRLHTASLCGRPHSSAGEPTDYLLRVPLKRIRALGDSLRALSIQAVAIGQVKSGGKVSVRIRNGGKDTPVAELPSSVLRDYPVMGLYRRRAEILPCEDGETPAIPPAVLYRIPEAGLLTASSAVTVSRAGQGYNAAMDAVKTAIAPLLERGIPAHTLRLSVALTSADGENAPGDLTVEALCGLYRAAAEGGIAMEDPAMTVRPLDRDQGPAVTLTVTAWVGHPASVTDNSIPTPPVPSEAPSKSIHTKGISAMNHVFEPLSKKPRAVILDTDIGPDCDDVGALVCLIDYAKKYGFPILGICNCTSNKAGTGTVDAVCRHCGVETPYLGQWSGPDFMNDAIYHKYNDAVAEKFSEAYRNGTLKTDDEVTFYRNLLSKAEDDSVMVITIGMFNNLASLLASGPDGISPLSGIELVRAKVNCLVSMAAILPEGRECNVMCDYKASQAVFRDWPTAVYLSDFHIGWQIMTGYDHIQDPAVIESHPLVMAYHYYTKDWTHLPVKGMNSSYDLTAIQFAAEGEGELYSLLDPVDLEFYAAIPEQPDLPDATRAIPNPEGKFRFMKKEASDEVIRDALNAILRSY